MTVYPSAVDDDSTIVRVDDNITEIGGLAINQLRDAVFAIEATLGLEPQGSMSSLADRVDVSINSNGTIKASALTSVGLVTLPITNSQVGSNAAILESKLALDFSTTDLYTLITTNAVTLTSLSAFAVATNSDLLSHIGGSVLLSDGSTAGRHVASHIDLNAVPSDSRDALYTWAGLLDKNGTARSATQVAAALLQINTALTTHENLTVGAHPATAITVDTSGFTELSANANTVQAALDEIDAADTLLLGLHRANMHANGVPRAARSYDIVTDGYNINIVPETLAEAFLANPPATTPIDSNTQGDDVIKFIPDNTNFLFDAKFGQVRPGDVISINYGNGVAGVFRVESTRFTPNSEWFVRINGYNLYDSIEDGYAYARIDRPLFDENTSGVMAVAAANNNAGIMSSLIVGSPRGANALGVAFEPGKLDSSHYFLYLALYPTGNPADYVMEMEPIDVTGNAGVTPGFYTLDLVVDAVNNAFRAYGYNYRFIAYAHNGNFGIMLADSISGAGFSIINGVLSGATLTTGGYTNNVVGDASDGLDALGLGISRAGHASPVYVSTFTSTFGAAQYPTKVMLPLRRRHYVVNGLLKDTFYPMPFANADGYWAAEISARTVVGLSTIETTYAVELDLCKAELKPGKTIVVQPVVDFDDGYYHDVDYGRFIIKSVSLVEACGNDPAVTYITVINGIHNTGDPDAFSSGVGLLVRLHFTEDSVSFNAANIVDAIDDGTQYNRYHEVFVDDLGRTFTHERARMIQQGPTTAKLDTNDRWGIRKVSPKLTGYIDSGSPNPNRWVRFYVASYDNATGIYDGYLGKRGPATDDITLTGELVSGHKNEVVRFYDESNVDYIDLIFYDEGATAGTAISDGTPHYVDIEIFPDLSLNDELMLLAGCDLDDETVRWVGDMRQFGNVSEKDFSDSAIDFITAGHRALAENGVIRGLTLRGIGVDDGDDSVIHFNGGMCLVNGRILAASPASIKIPEIRLYGAALPATVNWAVCINESGYLEAILIVSADDQYFATPNGSSSYLVKSSTFAELVTSRKDLCLISMVVAAISSIALSASDARKIVLDVSGAPSFIWNGDGARGNFENVTALIQWINGIGLQNNKVMVRGTHNITESIDLRGLTSGLRVEFIGDRAIVNVTAAKGFIFNSGVTFRDMTFNYNPAGLVYTAGDVVNSGNACLYMEAESAASIYTINNIKVKDCTFITAGTGQMPPMIGADLSAQGTGSYYALSNIEISGNTFIATLGTTVHQAAIAIVNKSNSTLPVTVNGLRIMNNHCALNVGIVIVSSSTASAFLIDGEISGNKCAAILTGQNGADLSVIALGYGYLNGLNIRGNNCAVIARADNTGVLGISNTALYGTGVLNINDNSCGNIFEYARAADSSPRHSNSLIISGNMLMRGAVSVATFLLNNFGLTDIIAIDVIGRDHANNTRNSFVKITNNSINVNIVSSALRTYSTGIRTAQHSIVSGNEIIGFTAYGIFINHSGTTEGELSVEITGNKLFRDTQTITAYIGGPLANTLVVRIVDNYFDSHTIDGASNTALVANAGDDWVIERNRNQTVTDTILPAIIGEKTVQSSGGVNTLIPGAAFTINSSASIAALAAATPALLFTYADASTAKTFVWYAPLCDLLPAGSKLISISASYQGSFAPDQTDDATLSLLDYDGGIATESDADLITASPTTLTIIANGVWTPKQSLHTRLSFDIDDSAASGTVSITTISITYRY